MTKIHSSSIAPLILDGLGKVVSTAHRYSDRKAYQDAVIKEKEQRHYPNPTAPDTVSYSFRNDDDTELLFVYQPPSEEYATECEIPYYAALIQSEFGLKLACEVLLRLHFSIVEPIDKSLRGPNDKADTKRVVLLNGKSYRGVIINPAYPIFRFYSANKYVPLLAGVAVGLALVPLVRSIGNLLRKRH